MHTRPAVRASQLAGWHLDGLIAAFVSPRQSRSARAAGLVAINVAHMFADELPSVTHDNYEVGRLAGAHLRETGLRHFAFVGPPKAEFARERLQGFQKGIIAVPQSREWPMPRDEVGEARLRGALSSWLTTLPRPTGLLAATDFYARLVVDACMDAGLQVPDELAVVGVNDDPVECDRSMIPLTCVRLDCEAVGKEAVHALGRLLRGAAPPAKPVRIAPQGLVVRKSSDTFAWSHPGLVKAMRWLNAHAKRSLRVSALARHAGMSRRSLETLFRREVGLSPHQEHLRLRVCRACELLADPSRSLDAVADECGFGSISHFYSLFKRHTGTSPASWRRVRRGTDNYLSHTYRNGYSAAPCPDAPKPTRSRNTAGVQPLSLRK